MRSKLTPLFVAAALAASMASANAHYYRTGMRAGFHHHHHYGMAHGRYVMGPRYGYTRVRYGAAAYGAAPAYYGAGAGYYGGYSDAGPFDILAAPFDAVGGAVGGVTGGLFGDDVYGYGGAGCCGGVYGAAQPPVVAGY